jgi:hypothetical protein
LYLRDFAKVEELIRLYEESRDRSVARDEFREIEWNLVHSGSRRAFRDDGQIITGLVRLSCLFDTQVKDLDIERGYVKIKICHPDGDGEVEVRMPLQNSRKQDARVIFSDYIHQVQDIDEIEDDVETRINRRFFFKFIRNCTLTLKDALHLYTMGGFRDFQLGPIIPPFIKRPTWMFIDSPFTEFLLFTELLRTVCL